MECQTVDLLLDRRILVELPYLLSSFSTEWASRGGDLSVVIRIPCGRVLEDIHGFGHHMTGILCLFSQGELTEHLDVLDTICFRAQAHYVT